MAIRKSDRGATIWEYALGVGLVAGALIGVAAFILPSALNISFVNTVNATTDNNQVIAQSFGTPTDPFAAIAGFQNENVKTIVSQMSIACIDTSQVCFPSFSENALNDEDTLGGLGETSGGLGQQQYLDMATNYIMTAIKDILGKKNVPESLKEKFRELANLSQEMASAQQQLADALRRGDSARARQLVQRINGGSQVYISDKCLPSAICIEAGDGLFYNIIPANDPLSLTGQIALVRQEIAADENIGQIPSASRALDTVFSALEDRSRRIAVLMEGDPPIVKRYSEVDIQDFIATLTTNVSYLNSLVSSMNQEKNARTATEELAKSLYKNDNYMGYSNEQVDLTVTHLIEKIQKTLLADEAFARSLIRGTPDIKEATRLAMSAFGEFFAENSGESREIATKLRDDVLSDSEAGTRLIQAALENAVAARTMDRLLATITDTAEDGARNQDLYKSVVGILAKNPEIISGLQEMATSKRIDPSRVEATSRFLAGQISESARESEATQLLENNARHMLKAAEISCSAGRGEFSSGKCLG